MTIDRVLLRHAWPDGYLLTRGVLTVGGWEVVEADGLCFHKNRNNFGGSRIARPWKPGNPVGEWTDVLNEAARLGDLLPHVDPSDVATWAACLADMAKLHAQVDGRELPHHIPILKSGGNGVWVLDYQSPTFGVVTIVRTFNIDTDDPALALVRAMIELRS